MRFETVTLGTSGPEGTPGAPGKSAYELAVENGFSGTEAEWLAGLQGEPGPPGEPGLPGGDTIFVATRALLAAINPAAQNIAQLTELGREGLFRWSNANLSTFVTADATQGIYVAPASSTGLAINGSAGAWVRQYDGQINIRWFGAKGVDVWGGDYDFGAQVAPSSKISTATVAAIPHTLSFFSGAPGVTITLSGASTAGPLVAGSGSVWVSLTFTPTAGMLTLTVSGGTAWYPTLEPGSSRRLPSDQEAWQSFNALCALVPATGAIKLLIPPSPGVYTCNTFLAGPGVAKFVDIEATGARVNPSSFWRPGNIYLDPVRFYPLFATALAGATKVTLLDLARLSEFSVGGTVCLMCLDIQANGYPANDQFFEFNRITAINAGTGEITLKYALRYSYLSTYPQWGLGYLGGPASIVQTDPEWDTQIIYRGGTNNVTHQIYGTAREQTWIDWTNEGAPSIASLSERISYIRHKSLGAKDTEIDKLVSQIEFIESDIAFLNFQSTSIDKVTIDGTKVGSINGSPKNMIIRKSVIGPFRINSWGHGYTTSVYAEDSYIVDNGYAPRTMLFTDFVYTGNGVMELTVDPLEYADTQKIAALVPGSTWFFGTASQGSNCGCPFTILDIWRNATTLFIATSLPNTIPTTTFVGTPVTSIWMAPCQQISARSCTGSQLWRSLSRSPLEARPPYSYYNTGRITGPPPPALPDIRSLTQAMWGRLERLRINVLRPYTGALGTLTLHALQQYGATKIDGPFAGGAAVNYDPIVNLKLAGMRELLPPNAATGLQAGDTISTLTDSWFTSAVSPFISADISAETRDKWPIWQVEMITEQRV